MSQSPRQDETSAGPPSDKTPPKEDAQQKQIDDLLDQWEATYEAGDPLPVETLCEGQPELIPEIRQRVAALKAVDQKLAKRKKKSKRLSAIPTLKFETLIDDMEFLSSGGLGEVFVGEDDDLHRRVAIKFMHKKLCGKEERRGQFALEAEITGRLEHPGVVPLYGCGSTADNRPFYAMRFIEGETLDEAIKRYFKKLEAAGEHHAVKSHAASAGSNLSLEFRRLLTSFVSVCKTIAYAHNRGVVHRDIKPANVMIGRFGETIVVDWGLAVPVMRDERFRSSGEETLALSPGTSQSGSNSGRGSGTPAFMSPEQFSELAPTPANDIYSLGATLFALLCGKPPIRHKTLSEIRNDRIEGRLPELNEIRKGVPKQLQAIAYKAMQKEAKDRYPTALELARDVERYLADEPVTACQDSVGLKVARMARRHRFAAQTGVLGLLGCLVIAGVSTLWIRSQHNTAQVLRDRNLSTSATFIARACGYEIDRVWRVLEFEANAPQLRELVVAANQQMTDGQPITLDSQKDLQYYLQDRLDLLDNVPTVDRLFVLTQDGTQAARAPKPKEPQVGQNFAFRNYYTGLGFDLEPGSKFAEQIDQPLTGPKVYPSGVHMTSAYLSTQSDEQFLKVTFTVPIRQELENSKSKFIGVIGTSLKVGDLMTASRIDDANAYTWIADLREDVLEGRRRRGLILHYPQPVGLAERTETHRLSNDLVEELRNSNYAYGRELSEPWLEEVDGINEHYSIQPIRISGRDAKPFDLEWIVITVEPKK